MESLRRGIPQARTGREASSSKVKNNRIEGSHVRIRKRERTMQGFRSPGSAQRFLSIHAAFYNHFNARRHLISASEQRARRGLAFGSGRQMGAA
ncbi:MAG: IS6 family transposase [Alphaproteobacteria bacterium]|nr:IS6 family transposase [Alphaproteobacteria bacterium]